MVVLAVIGGLVAVTQDSELSGFSGEIVDVKPLPTVAGGMLVLLNVLVPVVVAGWMDVKEEMGSGVCAAEEVSVVGVGSGGVGMVVGGSVMLFDVINSVVLGELVTVKEVWKKEVEADVLGIGAVIVPGVVVVPVVVSLLVGEEVIVSGDNVIPGVVAVEMVVEEMVGIVVLVAGEVAVSIVVVFPVSELVVGFVLTVVVLEAVAETTLCTVVIAIVIIGVDVIAVIWPDGCKEGVVVIEETVVGDVVVPVVLDGPVGVEGGLVNVVDGDVRVDGTVVVVANVCVKTGLFEMVVIKEDFVVVVVITSVKGSVGFMATCDMVDGGKVDIIVTGNVYMLKKGLLVAVADGVGMAAVLIVGEKVFEVVDGATVGMMFVVIVVGCNVVLVTGDVSFVFAVSVAEDVCADAGVDEAVGMVLLFVLSSVVGCMEDVVIVFVEIAEEEEVVIAVFVYEVVEMIFGGMVALAVDTEGMVVSGFADDIVGTELRKIVVEGMGLFVVGEVAVGGEVIILVFDKKLFPPGLVVMFVVEPIVFVVAEEVADMVVGGLVVLAVLADGVFVEGEVIIVVDGTVVEIELVVIVVGYIGILERADGEVIVRSVVMSVRVVGEMFVVRIVVANTEEDVVLDGDVDKVATDVLVTEFVVVIVGGSVVLVIVFCMEVVGNIIVVVGTVDVKE